MRTCIKCGIDKHESEFADYSYQRTNVCKTCRNAYLKTCREKRAERIGETVIVRGEQKFTCRGFLFPFERKVFTDPYDYFDFADRTWLKEELHHDLVLGVLPVGMILVTPGFLPVVVMPDEKGQQVKAISEVMG